jgi:hypothetical protein
MKAGNTFQSAFRFPSARKQDPAVDAWLDTRSPELGTIARAWFGALRRSGDDVQELMHDGCPVACVGEVAFGYVNVFRSHVNVGFYFGADLDDPADLLEGGGKRMRHVKIRPGADLDAGALRCLIEDAYVNVKARVGIAGGKRQTK